MPKLIQIREEVTACSECAHRQRRGAYDQEWCSESGTDIADVCTIPEWCPLPDVPAPVEKRCGTCRWWAGGASVCHVPVPYWATGCVLTLERHGRDCPTWEAKESNG